MQGNVLYMNHVRERKKGRYCLSMHLFCGCGAEKRCPVRQGCTTDTHKACVSSTFTVHTHSFLEASIYECGLCKSFLHRVSKQGLHSNHTACSYQQFGSLASYLQPPADSTW